jgi:exonuclease SbcC
MKILAIRGKNLASLASRFEVDFRLEPLASAGLFAIAGPTGSGKSTLLDAVCVALYNDTPRLRGVRARRVSLPDVADAILSVQDPRNLLRRGTAEGYAEVDFVGNDGAEYRARWAVRRARGRSSGKLQAAEMRLTRIADGTPIGDGLREVQEAIESRLGLTFGQFTRAVLLAQNEFFAFLQADDNDRAELLEALTGSEDLALLSQRAFERSKAEQEELGRLRERLAGEQPLDGEARLLLEASCAAAELAADRHEKREAELKLHLQWHAACDSARGSEAAARTTLDRAIVDQAAAAPRQALLDLVEAIQEARQAISNRDRLLQEVESCRQVAAIAAKAAGEADQKAVGAQGELGAAHKSLVEAEAFMEAAKSQLDRAKALDAQIGALAPGRTQARQALDQAREIENKTHEALAAHDREHHRQTQALQRAQHWLAGHKNLESLGNLWSRWDSLLGQAGQQADRCTAEDARLCAVECEETQRRETFQGAQAALEPASATLADGESELADASRELETFDPESLAERRTALGLRRERLAAATSHWKELSIAWDRQRVLDEKCASLHSALAAADAKRIEVAGQRPQAEAALSQAQRSGDAARIACSEGVEALRHTLVNDEPCPVCGSCEHPYAIEEPALGNVLVGLEAKVTQCSEDLDRLRKDDATLEAMTRSAGELLADNQAERARLVRDVAESRKAWAASPGAAELADVAPAERASWLLRGLATTEKELADHAIEEGAYRRALARRDSALRIRDRAAHERAFADRAMHDAKAGLDRAIEASRYARDRVAAVRSHCRALVDQLDGAFSDSSWRDRWAANPLAFHEASRRDAIDWVTQSQRAQDLAAMIANLDAERKGLGAADETAIERSQRAAEALESADRKLESLIEERGRVFGARPVVEVETELQQAVARTKAEEDRAAHAAQRASHVKARAEEALVQARSALSKHETSLSEAVSALAEWISIFNAARTSEEALDLAGIRTLLRHSPGWIAAERESMRSLAAAIERENAVLRERADRRQRLEAEQLTLEPEEVVRLALSQAILDLGAVRDSAVALRLDLKQDDQRRDRTAELTVKLRRQEQVSSIWARLSYLIGSADGKKFRNYAQQLTLDVLLVHANRHLEDVARRYRLVRVKDILALLVVDQDMGGEIRSVHSLSGGETFLVSLALALGLASLSSHRVIVESLFIDEGFGSLDSETLATALDALDRLQAQGRKVGVISHVQEMTERIATQIQIRKCTGGRSEVVVGT